MSESVISERMLLQLKELSKISSFKNNFYLAGGTALAIHLNHRESVDLDFFSLNDFDINILEDFLVDKNYRVIVNNINTIHLLVENVKISLLKYKYPILDNFTEFEGINLASINDIFCMKMISISQRSEKKDFYDLYELIKLYKFENMKELLTKKYHEFNVNFYHIARSLVYFTEAENSVEPKSINGTNWNEVKNFFLKNEKIINNILLN